MNKCELWEKTSSAWPYDVGHCRGTKKIESCTCGGDKTKCDFYPVVRAEAAKAGGTMDNNNLNPNTLIVPLTSDQCESLIDFIETSLLDCIRQDQYIDNLKWVENIINAKNIMESCVKQNTSVQTATSIPVGTYCGEPLIRTGYDDGTGYDNGVIADTL